MGEFVPKDRIHQSGEVLVRDFEAFYLSERSDVIGLAYVLCRDPGVAEDLTQEAFTAAFRDWDRVRSMVSPEGWIRTVVANRARSRNRRLRLEKTRRAEAPDVAPPEPDVDTVAVWDAVLHLPRRQADAIILVFYADLSHEAAANVLGCEVSTLRTHLQRARKRLEVSLGEQL